MRTAIPSGRNHGLHYLVGNGCLLFLVLASVGLSRCNTGPMVGGGVESGGDDCAAEPDTDGDGVGDVCDPPDDAVFSFVTGDDTLRLSVDERLRPLEIVTPEATARIVWSDDSTMAEITVYSGEDTWTVTGDADFSDDATLAAISDIETETGLDLTVLRDWIVAHPGVVEATARGEQEAAQPPADVVTAVIAKPRPIYQSNAPPNVRRHLDMIADANAKAVDTYLLLLDALEHAEQFGPPELVPVLRDLIERYLDMRDYLHEFLLDQLEACVPCHSDCRVDCTPVESGACCYSEGGRTRCEDNMTQADCFARNDPVFRDGVSCGAGGTDACLSGCCISVPSPGGGNLECCQNLLRETCAAIEINGTDVSTLFSFTRRCEDPTLLCPICP